LPESMTRDAMLAYYSEYANMVCHEVAGYLQRIGEKERKAALYRRALLLACNGDDDQVAHFVSEAGDEQQ
jgi:hypothetical protein